MYQRGYAWIFVLRLCSLAHVRNAGPRCDAHKETAYMNSATAQNEATVTGEARGVGHGLAGGQWRLPFLALMEVLKRCPVLVVKASIIKQQHRLTLGPGQACLPQIIRGVIAQVEHQCKLGGTSVISILQPFLKDGKTNNGTIVIIAS